MPSIIDRRNKIIMGFSAKAGCTVSVKMFLDHMGLLEEALKYSDWIHNFRLKVFNKTYGQATPEDFKNKEYFKFKIVRNPYDRAVSSYLAFLLINKTSLSFADFIAHLKETDLKTCNEHWRLQTDEYHYDKVIKIENFESGISEINDLRNTKFKTNYISNHHHIQLKPKEFIGFKKFESFDTQIPNYKDFYNRTLRRNIKDLYFQDLQNFYKLDIAVL